MKRSSKSTHSENLNLSIVQQLKSGLRPSQICKSLKISKTALQYHLSSLKAQGIIRKIGYGVWEVQDQKEVQISTGVDTKTSSNSFVSLDDIIGKSKLRKILKNYKMNHCLFCKHSYFEIHHIQETSKGGKDTLRNLIPLCPNHHTEIHQKGLSELMNVRIKEFHNLIESKEELRADMVRGHGFVFKFELPKNLRNWDKREEILKSMNIDFTPLRIFGGGQKILFKGRNVWLTTKSIIIYEQESFIADLASESQSKALSHFFNLLSSLERSLRANFQINKSRFRVSRQHYALIKNALARQYNDEGKKLECYTGEGLWFLIDNSFNLNEAETVHPKTAVSDNKKVQEFFNGLKQLEGFTPQFVTNSLGVQAQNIENYAVHLKSHVESVQKLGAGVEELVKLIKELKK